MSDSKRDLNKVLFQAIKYLSRMRIKGESIPANILLISLNTTTCSFSYTNSVLKSPFTILQKIQLVSILSPHLFAKFTMVVFKNQSYLINVTNLPFENLADKIVA